jgi:hypothetical protein
MKLTCGDAKKHLPELLVSINVVVSGLRTTEKEMLLVLPPTLAKFNIEFRLDFVV